MVLLLVEGRINPRQTGCTHARSQPPRPPAPGAVDPGGAAVPRRIHLSASDWVVIVEKHLRSVTRSYCRFSSTVLFGQPTDVRGKMAVSRAIDILCRFVERSRATKANTGASFLVGFGGGVIAVASSGQPTDVIGIKAHGDPTGMGFVGGNREGRLLCHDLNQQTSWVRRAVKRRLHPLVGHPL